MPKDGMSAPTGAPFQKEDFIPLDRFQQAAHRVELDRRISSEE
jgi:hypothetical protein